MSPDWWWWVTPWDWSGPSFPPSGPNAPGATGIEGPRGNFPPIANLAYQGVADLMSAEMIDMQSYSPAGPTATMNQFLMALAGLLSTGLSGPAPYLVNSMARGLSRPVWQGQSGWAGQLILALAWQINGTGPVWWPPNADAATPDTPGPTGPGNG